MSQADRYQYTFHPQTGEPVGILDTWIPPVPKSKGVVRASNSIPPQVRVALLVLMFAFAAGLFGGFLLFGRHADQTTTVVVCPPPGVQVAARPAECGPPTGGEPR